jgi:hypothetical protein
MVSSVLSILTVKLGYKTAWDWPFLIVISDVRYNRVIARTTLTNK